MQMFQNLPWYGYVFLALGIITYAYKYIKTAKEGYDEADLKKAKFKVAEDITLTKQQLFSLALNMPLAEWFGADTNTLIFVNQKVANSYLKDWRIDSKVEYWDRTDYFMKEGRRWYYDFIHKMVKTQPKEQWDASMKDYFGSNERAFNYLKVVKNNSVLNELKQRGLITFDSEMDIGILAYDIAILVGQARIAFTADLITDQEAWKVINFASQLAKENFSSWNDFGKSYIIGFAFDQQHREKSYREEVYHIYKQVLVSPQSPWNIIDWA